MNESIKKVFILATSIFIVYFFYLLVTQVAQADIGAELRKKGEQCRAWVEAGDLKRHQAGNCLAACERYGHALEKHPEILSDAGVQGCNESYARTRNKIPGMQEPETPVSQAPETIEQMIEDMNKAVNKWKFRVEEATSSASKRQAEACYDSCSRGVSFVSRKGYPVNRAKSLWRGCVECKPYGASANPKLARKSTNQKVESAVSSMPDVEGVYVQAMQGKLRVRAEGRNDWNTICVEFARIKDRKNDYARKLKGQDRVRLIGITYNPDEPSGPRGKCSAERIVILGPSQ